MTRRDGDGRVRGLRTSGPGRRYGGMRGMRDCAIKVPAGAVAGLVGPNGAGKMNSQS